MTITPSDQRIWKLYCRGFKLLSAKMRNFVFFARRKFMDACLFFFQGWSYQTSERRKGL